MLAQLSQLEELEQGERDLNAALLYFERKKLEASLYEYVKATWHLVEPDQPFIENWHIRKMCEILHTIYRGHQRRTIFNVPPGTLKSLLVEVFWPTWAWARNPRKRFMTASYGQHLTTRDNLRARQIIESPWYQARWPVKMLEDQNTKTRYNTEQQGWRIATSVNGQGIGEHPDFIVIDDPTTDDQAQSDTTRQSANDWFDRTIATRLGRNPSIVVIMQRLHADDLSGHLLKRGGWVHVRWPMRFEQCACNDQQKCGLHRADPEWAPDPTDERTQPGQLLFDELFPEEKVKELEKNLGPYGTAGQLQQRPSPEGGGLFKREWFADKIIDALPAYFRACRGWDTAGTEGGGDYTAGVKLFEELVSIPDPQRPTAKPALVPSGRIIVADIQHDQLGPDGVDSLMKSTAQLDGVCMQREEREGGASGKAVITSRAKLLKGHDYMEVTVGTNKIVRSKPFRSQCAAGNVYLLRAQWNEKYIRELCAFPTGLHDDLVDGSSAAYNALVAEEPKKTQSATWGRR